MNRTKIEWVKNPDGTQGFTWNPITGCENGCFYCYACKLAHRWQAAGIPQYRHGFKPTFQNNKLEEPIFRKKPSGIFVVSMGDLLGAWVPKEWIEAVIDTMKCTPRHRYYILTKNPGRYAEFRWPRNAWLGATATDQESFDRASCCRVRHPNTFFVSCEPMLGPIHLRDYSVCDWLDWLIVGVMTGPGSKKHLPPPKWIDNLVRDARKYDIPVFVKDNVPFGDDKNAYLRDIQEMPS